MVKAKVFLPQCNRVTDRQEKTRCSRIPFRGYKKRIFNFWQIVDYPVSNQPHRPPSLPKLSKFRDCLVMYLFPIKLEYPSFVHYSLLISLFWQRSKVMSLKVSASMHVMMPSAINISRVNTFQILPESVSIVEVKVMTWYQRKGIVKRTTHRAYEYIYIIAYI